MKRFRINLQYQTDFLLFLHNHGAPYSLLCAYWGIRECMCCQWNLYPCIYQSKTVEWTASFQPRLLIRVQQSDYMRAAWWTSRASAPWHRRGNNIWSCGKCWNRTRWILSWFLTGSSSINDFGAYARPTHKWTCVQFLYHILDKTHR